MAEMIFAGFGQGVMSMGMMLAYAEDAGRKECFLDTVLRTGDEGRNRQLRRGGYFRRIGSPFVTDPDVVVA